MYAPFSTVPSPEKTSLPLQTREPTVRFSFDTVRDDAVCHTQSPDAVAVAQPPTETVEFAATRTDAASVTSNGSVSVPPARVNVVPAAKPSPQTTSSSPLATVTDGSAAYPRPTAL